MANPDLRMAGNAWGWFPARAKLRDQTLTADRISQIQPPVLVLNRKAAATSCLRMPHSVEQSIAASGPYQQAEDRDRAPWLNAI